MSTVTGAEFQANLPKEAGDCVGIIEFHGRLFIACQFGVFEFFPSLSKGAKGTIVLVDMSKLERSPTDAPLLLNHLYEAISISAPWMLTADPDMRSLAEEIRAVLQEAGLGNVADASELDRRTLERVKADPRTISPS